MVQFESKLGEGNIQLLTEELIILEIVTIIYLTLPPFLKTPT